MITHHGSSLPTTWEIQPEMVNTDLSYVYLDTIKSRYISASEDTVKGYLGSNFSLLSDDLLQSDTNKYLITLNKALFHVIQDTISVIIKLHKMDPTGVFLLYANSPNNNKYDTKIDTLNTYFEELLDALDIKYVIVPPANEKFGRAFSSVVSIRNYIDVAHLIQKNNFSLSLDDIYNTSLAIRGNVGVSGVEPHRKVYLSRSHMESLPTRRFDVPADYNGYTDDIRMPNEKLLEEFFSSKGYEILIPENKFSTFKEQIQYMESVKIFAATSGSGLLNSLFMNNEQFVVEIVAEIVQSGASITHQAIPNWYSNNSFIKRHTHLLVPSWRDPDEAIRLLNKSVELLNSLS